MHMVLCTPPYEVTWECTCDIEILLYNILVDEWVARPTCPPTHYSLSPHPFLTECSVFLGGPYASERRALSQARGSTMADPGKSSWYHFPCRGLVWICNAMPPNNRGGEPGWGASGKGFIPDKMWEEKKVFPLDLECPCELRTMGALWREVKSPLTQWQSKLMRKLKKN